MQNKKSWRLSWFAYFKSLLFLPLRTLFISIALMIILSIALALLSHFVLEESTIQSVDSYMKNLFPNHKWIPLYLALLIWAITTAFFAIFLIFSLRRVRLYYDDEGVWLYSGIFPWSKGFNGIKWRDLDSGIYTTGFLSWLLKSYSIIISHRFTKDFEIAITHIHRGDEFVRTINEIHIKCLELNMVSET